MSRVHNSQTSTFEDLEAICEDTLREYAKGILAQVRKAVEADVKLTDLILKEEFYLDAVTDMP